MPRRSKSCTYRRRPALNRHLTHIDEDTANMSVHFAHRRKYGHRSEFCGTHSLHAPDNRNRRRHFQLPIVQCYQLLRKNDRDLSIVQLAFVVNHHEIRLMLSMYYCRRALESRRVLFFHNPRGDRRELPPLLLYKLVANGVLFFDVSGERDHIRRRDCRKNCTGSLLLSHCRRDSSRFAEIWNQLLFNFRYFELLFILLNLNYS